MKADTKGKEAGYIKDGFCFAVSLLSPELRALADRLPGTLRGSVEEFRLRAGFPATALTGDTGVEHPLGGRRLTERDLREVLERASDYSYHTVAEELRQGYLSARGGVRIGVCGTAAGGNFRELSSLTVRVPRQLRMEGAEYGFLSELPGKSVLVVSPPGRGKTTLLRELIRRESERGQRVAVADERGELAAVWKGEAQFSLGPCTDILSGAGKAEATVLLLRAMNPQVLAMDEIGTAEDIRALERVAGCGVRLLATVHGDGVESLGRRKRFRRLLRAGIFQKAVCISGGGQRKYRVEDI